MLNANVSQRGIELPIVKSVQAIIDCKERRDKKTSNFYKLIYVYITCTNYACTYTINIYIYIINSNGN